jgi:hypothetical protein
MVMQDALSFKPFQRLTRSLKTRYVAFVARDIIRRQIHALKERPDSPFAKSPRQGYLRGIDFYDEPELLRVMALAMAQFRKVHGVFPDLLNPRGFNEKIVWTKFFAEIKIPESGNKLLTSSFIPDDLKNALTCPPIHWHSPVPRLPLNHELAPGYYYMKASHGSGMFKRIRYPLADPERPHLERLCKKWLNTPYGLRNGQWWYNVFEKEILLDPDVTGESRSVAHDFFVFGGRVEHITFHRKTASGADDAQELTRLDADFRPVPAAFQPDRPPVREEELPDDIKTRLKEYASRIAAPFPFARVDFVLGQDGCLYLLEVTFSPANGHAKRPAELDRWLGDRWTL